MLAANELTRVPLSHLIFANINFIWANLSQSIIVLVIVHMSSRKVSEESDSCWGVIKDIVSVSVCCGLFEYFGVDFVHGRHSARWDQFAWQS